MHGWITGAEQAAAADGKSPLSQLLYALGFK
jgi:hypothetical protein